MIQPLIQSNPKEGGGQKIKPAVSSLSLKLDDEYEASYIFSIFFI